MEDSDDEILMPEIIVDETFEPEPMEVEEDEEDIIMNEPKRDIKNEDIFKNEEKEEEVYKVPKIKPVKEEVNEETGEENENFIYESDDEEPKEYVNGDKRKDGKVYYNGKWKSQKQLDHLKKMREKRWENQPKKKEPKQVMDESMIEQIALKTITEYKKQRRAKKLKLKEEEETKKKVVIKEEKNVEKVIEKPKLTRQVSKPIHNIIYNDQELKYSDCF